MADFINKNAVNTNKATNYTGAISGIAVLLAAIEGVTNGQPFYVWLPSAVIGLTGAISQWLQGVPSAETKLIAKVLDLQPGDTNADIARDLVRRFTDAATVQATINQVLPQVSPPEAIRQPRHRSAPPVAQPSFGATGFVSEQDIATFASQQPIKDFAQWQAEKLASDDYADITQGH